MSSIRFFHFFSHLFLMCLVLSGCQQGLDYRKPLAPANESYQYSEAGKKIVGEWYQLYHSETLNQLIQDSLHSNPNLASARHALLASHYELQAVSGQTNPQLSLSAATTRSRMNGSFLLAPAQSYLATGNRFSIGPSLAYRLDLSGGVKRAIENQEALVQVSEAEVLNVYITLIDEIVSSALKYDAILEQIDKIKEIERIADQELKILKNSIKAGKILLSEHSDLDYNIAQIKQYDLDLELQKTVLLHKLAVLTGRSPKEFEDNPLNSFHILHNDDQTIPLALPSELVDHRPDILIAEAALHSASAKVGIAEAARLPAVILTGNFTQQATQTRQWMTQPGSIWSFGLNVAQTIFDGGTLASYSNEALENYEQSLEHYQSVVLHSFNDVSDSLKACDESLKIMEQQKVAVQKKQTIEEITKNRYLSGKTSRRDYLQALVQRLDAENSFIKTNLIVELNKINLFKSLGGGWWDLPLKPSEIPQPIVNS